MTDKTTNIILIVFCVFLFSMVIHDGKNYDKIENDMFLRVANYLNKFESDKLNPSVKECRMMYNVVLDHSHVYHDGSIMFPNRYRK